VLLGRGRGETEVDPTPYVPRSHGREVTFQRNLSDWTQVAAEITRLAHQVGGELTNRPVARVVVKVRYAPFDTVTHGVPLAEFDSMDEAARAALAKFEADRPVRLLGVRAEFADNPV